MLCRVNKIMPEKVDKLLPRHLFHIEYTYASVYVHDLIDMYIGNSAVRDL